MEDEITLQDLFGSSYIKTLKLSRRTLDLWKKMKIEERELKAIFTDLDTLESAIRESGRKAWPEPMDNPWSLRVDSLRDLYTEQLRSAIDSIGVTTRAMPTSYMDYACEPVRPTTYYYTTRNYGWDFESDL